MTQEEVRTHPLFLKLTDKQQIFLNALCTNGGDKVAAAHEAWICSGDESARALANKNLKNPHVAHLWAEFCGDDPTKLQFTREGALAFAAEKARGITDPKLALDYLRLIVQMNGWLVRPTDKPEAPAVDDSNDPFTL